ncbi:hypothetical protein OG949_27245 [Streptomyces scopuliridis]|uniref:hypothetical protein n=1 Tax=Streptomyces scopuliridis TaxID=452529 RepID=UPI002DD7A3AB|nr:hypothetical protein [Streptomyces scopuliridis]WSB38795.1 hypothetical protein OG949_27245 [Streptomyces scopuliridis]
MTDATSPIRALRAAAFAAVCVTLAAVGHSFTSGHEIPLGALWTAFGVTAGVAWLAGGRRRGFRSIGAGLLTVQGGLHLIFAGALPFGGAEAPSHLPHGAATGTGTGMDTGEGSGAGVLPVDAAVPFGLDGTAGMLAAHLLAAAVCALWLARGEAALFRLASALGVLAFSPLRLLLTAARPPLAPRPTGVIRRAPAAHRFRGVVLAHTLSRRGPPARRTSRATAPATAFITTVRTVRA